MSEKNFYICTRYVDKFVLIATTEKNAKTIRFSSCFSINYSTAFLYNPLFLKLFSNI